MMFRRLDEGYAMPRGASAEMELLPKTGDASNYRVTCRAPDGRTVTDICSLADRHDRTAEETMESLERHAKTVRRWLYDEPGAAP